MPDEVAAVTQTYQLILWAVPQVNKWPRDHRFTLGDRVVTHLYDLLELLVEASYTRDKAGLLARANLKVDLLRYLFRLANDLDILGLRRYEHASKLLVELGQQVGGWKRAASQRRGPPARPGLLKERGP